jgi:hypothetical protein
VVSDGTRIHRVTGNAVMASSVAFGSSLGFGNLGDLTTHGNDLVVYVGGDQSVNRITLPPETALFATGFENP